MVASTSVPLGKKSQDAFIAYYKSIHDSNKDTRESLRARFIAVDKAYQREVISTQAHWDAKILNEAGDNTKYQDIVVPVVMPQVEAAVVYQTAVFLTGSPLFAVGSSPAFMDAALQLQTILENNSVRGGWAREFILFFRDAFKYNFAPLHVCWADEVSYSVETNLAKDLRKGQPKEVIWSGNKVKRWDPYNTFIDSNVAPSEVYKKGEFAGTTELMTRIELKAFIASLSDKIIANITTAFSSGTPGAGFSVFANSSPESYNVPVISQTQNISARGTNWLSWAGIANTNGTEIEYKNVYEVTTLYVRILPAEFGLRVPRPNTPQIYKLIIINHEHIIYAELQTNAHNYIPVLIGCPLEDGLAYQTKSLADNGVPFQQLATAYMSSIIASRKRAISDRTLYDSSRITERQINNPNPSAKIPVRPSVYGKSISEAVYAFPYREDQQASSMQQIQAILGLANVLNGQNQASQGQFVKGNKTLSEFESVMQNANGRDQLASILLEAQVFTPLKELTKIDILQYQGGTTLYNQDKGKEIEIDPIALRKAVLSFKVSDGLIPESKLLNTDAFTVALQTLANSPQLAAGYNISPLFSYLMKTQGADLKDFEKSPEQLAFESAYSRWIQIAQQAVDKGVDPATLPPAPIPEQFNYDPRANNPQPEQMQQSPPQMEMMQNGSM